jgi:transposase
LAITRDTSTNTVASLAEPEPILSSDPEEVWMIVGIDVHKRTHTAALIDQCGGVVSTLRFANHAAGVVQLRDWLDRNRASGAIVGVENAAGYGRLVCAALTAAGHEVVNVPAWRTHRDRHQQGPGKSDPADAVAVAQVVLRSRERLGPALEPELIRALALLETLRRQLVYRRTDAIQRLRAIWTQINPEAEAAVHNIATQRALRRLKRIRFGDGLAEQTAADCVRDLAAEIERFNTRIAHLDEQLAT